MKALILASLASTYMQSEVQELLNSLTKAKYSVQLLQVNISTIELYRMLGLGPPGLVWVSCHMDANGFSFGDVIITPKELGMFLRQARTKDLVLNTCHSIQHVVEIQRQANVNIVATINPEITDSDAWTYALYLGKKLSESDGLQAAYQDTVADSTSEYRWFPAPKISEARMTSGEENDLQELQRTVEQLEVTMGRLVRALQGDSMMRSKGLIEMVQSLEARVQSLEQKVDGNKLILTRWGAVIVVVVFIALALGLIYFTSKLGGGGPVAVIQFDPLFTDLGLLLTDGYESFGIP